MAEYIITQEDLAKGNSYLKTLTTEHPVCRIADGVIGIPDSAFRNCSSLTSITIPNSVTSIGGGAFNGCTSLTSITIPDSVTSIGYSAFNGCTNLTSIAIGDGVTSISERAFYNCSSLTSITIPDSVTEIGSSAFESCTSLTSITIPSSVTSIGNDVFAGCTNLKTIDVPEDFDTTLLDGKVPEGATIEVKRVEELITLNQLKAYDDEKTNIWHNSFTTNNLTVVNGNVTNLAVSSSTVDTANITNLTVNSSTTNNLTVSNSVINNAVINSANVADLTVNSSTVVNGNVFTHKGFDVASIKVISEYDYNRLGAAARNDAFYVTGPNGNMYFMGAKWAPSYVPSYLVAYVQLPNMANNMTSLTTSTLTFTSGAVTNNFVNGGKLNSIYKKTPFGETVDMSLSVGTQANNGSIITNANELYITDASYMYDNCQNLTDTFVCNPSLITNAPTDYDPMRYCTNMANMFANCHNFNQPVNIPDSVTAMNSTFGFCKSFNQPVKIGNSVTAMVRTFGYCDNFNQPVNIPDSVVNMTKTFYKCTTLASSTVPIHISRTIAVGNTSNYIYNSLVNGLTGITFDPSRILNDL